MRSKKVFSFDEERDAEEVIKNGFPNGSIDYNKMYLVAKYFRKTLKYGAIRLERELIRFCKEQDRNFNPVIEAESIKKWVNSAMNYGLRKIESVTISQGEINALKKIEVPNERKLIFIAFILAKALKKRGTKKGKKVHKTSEHYYIHYNNFSDIIKLSKIKNISEVKLAGIFHKHKHLFTFYNAQKELIRLDFVDKSSKNSITLDNLDKALEHYDLLLGKTKPISVCVICGNEFTKNNNKQKRCKDCSLKLRREQKRLWIKKAREL